MHPTLHLRAHYTSSAEVLYVDSIVSASCLHRMSSNRSHQLEHTHGVIQPYPLLQNKMSVTQTEIRFQV
jgi:hypothetical protein